MKRLAFLGMLAGCGDSSALHLGPDAASDSAGTDAPGSAAQTLCGQQEPTTAPSAIVARADVSSFPEFIIDGALVEAFRAGDSAPLASIQLPQEARGYYAFDMSIATNGVPFAGFLRARIGHGLLDGYWYPAAPLGNDIVDDDTLQLVTPPTTYYYTEHAHDPSLGLVHTMYTDCGGNGVYGATVTVSPPAVVYYQSSSDPTTMPSATTYSAAFYVSPGTYTITVASPGILWRTTTIEVFANSWNNVEIKPL